MVVSTQTRKERDEQNALLKRFGYRWTKEGQSGKWILLNPNGGSVTPELALETIKSGRSEKAEPRFSTANREAAILWAHSLTSRRQHHRPVVFLDTETTGVDMTAVAVQISIINLRNNVLLDTLVHIDGSEMSEKAQETHGIGIDRLNDAPMFTTIWDKLQNILTTSDLIAFNAPFDFRVLTQTAAKYGLRMPAMKTHCLMQQYSMFIGEVTSTPMRPETYKVQSLAAACEHFGIENSGAHDALGDASAARDVLVAMAALYDL